MTKELMSVELHVCKVVCRKLAVVAGVVAASCAPAPQATAGVFKVPVYQSGTEGYNIYRIPTMVKAANGDLLAFAEAREGGDASEIDIVVKRSTNAGKTWSPLEVVQDNADFRQYFPAGQTPPPITVGNQSPVVDMLDPAHPGRIWLPFTLENDRVFISYSDDHGVTWSNQVEITSTAKNPTWDWYATGPVQGIQLTRGDHAGRLIIPSDHGAPNAAQGAHVLYSDDHGQTWQIGAVDTNVRSQSDSSPNENFAVELVDGRVYFNARDGHADNPGNRVFAYSSDGGMTYDQPQFVHDPRITTPVVQNSGIRFRAVDEGDAENVILYSGPGNASARRDLTIRVSNDETASWSKSTVIHQGPAAYSDLVKLNDERFGVLFEAGDSLYDEILFAYMDYDDLDPAPWNGVHGDVDQDGVFNQQDVSAFIAAWTPLSGEYFLGGVDSYANGDLNFDGRLSLADVFELRQQLIASGLSAEGLAQLTQVPEASSLQLFVIGLITCALRGTP
ncbi:exo-alpha-sialidase [Lacipirellula parvula]|uniref:exo-alpha-sialidase n=1 Tax=Lacipirellula parvula TaxID=2650471 RepID=A0A5K7XJQ0_9BACT|nr:exo-alpha-sialidase [Lacipirellula parvula]BBO34636.1 sialidase [Lacipirellula parvula]